MADAGQGDGSRQIAASARRGETLTAVASETADALGLVAGTVPATPLKYGQPGTGPVRAA